MTWIVAIKPYLEVISFAATTILAIGLILSRQQLSAFRNDIAIRNVRQAKEKAVEAAKYYLIDYVEACKTFDRNIGKVTDITFEGEVGDFTSESLSKKEYDKGMIRLSNEKILDVLNSFEIVSAYFVSGVADEKTGFQIIGKSFCSNVRYNYAVITLLREENSVQNYWFNILELFHVWNSRITKMNLSREHDELQKTLRNLSDLEISAIGTLKP